MRMVKRTDLAQSRPCGRSWRSIEMRRIAIVFLMVVFGLGSSVVLAGPAPGKSGTPARPTQSKPSQLRPAVASPAPVDTSKSKSPQASSTSSGSSQASSEPNSLLMQFGPSGSTTMTVPAPSAVMPAPARRARTGSSAVTFASPTFVRPTSSSVTYTPVGFTSVGYTRPTFASPTFMRPAFTSSTFTSPAFTSPAFMSSTFTSPTFSQMGSAQEEHNWPNYASMHPERSGK